MLLFVFAYLIMRGDKMHINSGPNIHLDILGSFELYTIDGENRRYVELSSKLRSILCYIVLRRGRAVTQAELIDTFYADEDTNNPAGALKMQILRIRNLLGTLLGGEVVPIISQRGAYKWNPEIACIVDAEEFERACAEADNTETDVDKRLQLYHLAMELYKGAPALSKTPTLWSEMLEAGYHSAYVSAVENYAALLDNCARYSEVESVCLKALQADSTNETLYILLIRALLHQNRKAEARYHYDRITDALFREMGVQTSAELQQYFSQFADDEVSNNDLGAVLAAMRNPDGKRSAFLCGFEQFKNIYQLEVRRIQRTGDCMHIALLTISDVNGNSLSEKVNDALMEQLQQTVIHSLRQSDVVAKYSTSQLIIMLPQANLENSYMVMDRIVKRFHDQNPRTVVRLSYQIRELELL